MLAYVVATVVVVLLLQWFEDLEIWFLESSEIKVKQVSFRKKQFYFSPL